MIPPNSAAPTLLAPSSSGLCGRGGRGGRACGVEPGVMVLGVVGAVGAATGA